MTRHSAGTTGIRSGDWPRTAKAPHAASCGWTSTISACCKFTYTVSSGSPGASRKTASQILVARPRQIASRPDKTYLLPADYQDLRDFGYIGICKLSFVDAAPASHLVSFIMSARPGRPAKCVGLVRRQQPRADERSSGRLLSRELVAVLG